VRERRTKWRRAAKAYTTARAIKIKLTADDPAGCVHAVRAARPDVWMGVDANQGFTRSALEKLLPALIDAHVALIEQPFAGRPDAELDGLQFVPFRLPRTKACRSWRMGALVGATTSSTSSSTNAAG
jgi:L-alanine-DL-glutamate epimerase-like enolase superfamily enzyme